MGTRGDICLEASYLAAQDQDAGLVTFNNTSLCPSHPTGIAQSTTERLVKVLWKARAPERWSSIHAGQGERSPDALPGLPVEAYINDYKAEILNHEIMHACHFGVPSGWNLPKEFKFHLPKECKLQKTSKSLWQAKLRSDNSLNILPTARCSLHLPEPMASFCVSQAPAGWPLSLSTSICTSANQR